MSFMNGWSPPVPESPAPLNLCYSNILRHDNNGEVTFSTLCSGGVGRGVTISLATVLVVVINWPDEVRGVGEAGVAHGIRPLVEELLCQVYVRVFGVNWAGRLEERNHSGPVAMIHAQKDEQMPHLKRVFI